MIKYVEGNLLESDAQALVNTVNTVGVMGKGIALQFKNAFPSNYKIYRKACGNEEVGVGKLLITIEENLISGKKIIINFPTKTDWRKPSEYSYIENGLIELRKFIIDNSIESVAIPPLGAGNGGLDWQKVKTLIEKYLSDLNASILVYQPNAKIKEVLKKERVKLTPARAMLLAVLYELVKNGEFVSEFSAEKIAYFLQRFGAKNAFNLEYKPNFYGPYSGKVKHLLYYLNGSYILGYSSKDKKPFEEIGLVMDTEDEVLNYLKTLPNQEYFEIIEKTKSFLEGFYSPFGLELLSTIDYITEKENIKDSEMIISKLNDWSNRKTELFSNHDFVNIALERINNFSDSLELIN
ncbi:MAG: macro domain-containing protein [Flavobacteriaceae bacterium]|jgi:O-acetyl-ADP-ribose deacetylase (regulator of RNase III)|nr:macro domain-containing protein [Flavobacteriaceae bacterium]